MGELAAIFVEEAPEFEFRGGLFYVIVPGRAPRVMRPNTFFAAVASAAKAGKQFKFGGAEIVPFPGEDHAASS